MRRNLLPSAFGLAILVLCGCGGATPPDDGVVRIGVAGPMTGDLAQFGKSLLGGATLAMEEINASGGVLGKKIVVEAGDDKAQSAEGQTVARNFIHSGRVPVVLGHFNSGVSGPAGELYNQAGVVMITPASTNPAVTSPSRPFVFRNLPTDDQNGEKLADFVVTTLGKRRILLVFANNPYGKGLADYFTARARAIGGQILDRAQYNPDADEDFRSILTRWKGLGGEAIVVCGETPKAAQFILQAREMGIDLPVAGGDGLASPDLWNLGKEASRGTYVVSYFDPGNPDPSVAAFVDRFTTRFGHAPDVWAAQAYDAMRLAVDAITRAGSTEPDRIREALAATQGWQGVTGVHRFENGNCVGKQVIVTKVDRDGAGSFRFVYHATVVAAGAVQPADDAPDTGTASEGDSAAR